MARDLLHQRFTADARNRRFARRVHIRQQQEIRRGKATAEFRAQELCARVTVRLEHADKPSRLRLPRRRKRRRDLGRVMRIVVDHPNAAFLSLRLESPLRSMKMRESIRDAVKIEPRKTRDGDAGERVEDIVPPGNVEGDASERRTALKDGEGNHGTARLDIRSAVIRRRIDGIGDDRAVGLRPETAQNLVLVAEHRRTVRVDLRDERTECLDDFLHRAVVIHVVVLHIGHDGDMRAELKEGTVALVRLGDEIAARAELCVRPEVGDFAADDDGRRYARAVERHADH